MARAPAPGLAAAPAPAWAPVRRPRTRPSAGTPPTATSRMKTACNPRLGSFLLLEDAKDALREFLTVLERVQRDHQRIRSKSTARRLRRRLLTATLLQHLIDPVSPLPRNGASREPGRGRSRAHLAARRLGVSAARCGADESVGDTCERLPSRRVERRPRKRERRELRVSRGSLAPGRHAARHAVGHGSERVASRRGETVRRRLGAVKSRPRNAGNERISRRDCRPSATRGSRWSPGGSPGLQNRCAGRPPVGRFDSDVLPP